MLIQKPENSPQNKITGCNQFFEGKFRQFVKTNLKKKFKNLGSQIPYFNKNKSQKNLILFLKPPKIATVDCKMGLRLSTFILRVAPNLANHNYQQPPINHNDNFT
jgi:hypothetical protein